jgi:hypothetical protein
VSIVGSGMMHCEPFADFFGSMLFAVLYWYVWIKLVPRIGGYRVEEEADVLADGTTITSLVKVMEKESDSRRSLRSRFRCRLLWRKRRSNPCEEEDASMEERDAFIEQDDRADM